MSTMSKPGPCRIPTFGSRIPQQIPKQTSIPVPEPAPSASTITAKHCGKKVRVGEKEGILRYVGNVHFAKGVWCGVELADSIVGKNDGTVNGVRYFACSALRGLMAPHAKVALIEGSCESLNDDSSGPYSMLFLDPKLPDSGTYRKDTKGNNCTNNFDNTVAKCVEKKLTRDCTYDLGSNSSSLENLHEIEDLNRTITNDKNSKNSLNDTFCDLNSTLIRIDGDETYDVKAKEEQFKSGVIFNSQVNSTFDVKEKSDSKDRRITYEIKHLNETNTTGSNSNKKRTNTTFDKVAYDADIVNTTIALKSDNLTYTDRLNRSEEHLDRTVSYLPIDKSCEDLLNESSIEVKRRRTSNPRNQKIDSLVLQRLTQKIDKPSSLPHNLDYCNSSFLNSTQIRSDFTDNLLRKLRISIIPSDNNLDDDSNKRDSLDCEESLGILTPDQMLEGNTFQSRSPSLEYAPSKISETTYDSGQKSELQSPKDSSIGILDEKLLEASHGLNVDVTKTRDSKEELQSPNLNSITDYSLGIIDDHMLSNFTLKTDTTMNMELPLDKSKDFTLTRCEQTPSPEELPLDTTPIVESEPKTEPTKSKTTSSFITSITSITSLDTGYQGDGEMSRPASRGADNSPLTRRPLPRPQPRRPDPMTDSDFYTESDADNHEENQLRGDRRAQVIDGTLYGVDPQAAADIYVNNRENMDSSGIFTDIESNTRTEEEVQPLNETLVSSPSDSTSKTLSENSQNNLQDILLDKTPSKNEKAEVEKTPTKENPKKRNAPSPGISSPSSISSPRHTAKNLENSAKKYKMPKRDVASKVKAMLEPTQAGPQSEKKTVKKPVGRWDAVMNKISKNEQNKTNLKDIKSKVFNNVSVNASPGSVQRQNDVRKTNTRVVGNQNNKNRRMRTRTALNNSSSPKNNVTGSNVESSIHSSLSDLSAATTPPKKTPGSAKKREKIQVTQVLTANKLSPRNQHQQNSENKKTPTSSLSEPKSKRTIFSAKEKKQPTSIKECAKTTVKGGRTSPSVRPPASQNHRAPVKQHQVPRVAEALAVLVQHLVFNVEAYQVPTLRREVEKFRLESEEIRLACQHLEETLADERTKQSRAIEDERVRCRKDITDLIEKHRNQIAHLTNQHADIEERLRSEKENAHQHLFKQHEDQLVTLKQEFVRLQRTHEESLDILREENESIREQIDEKQMEVKKANHESMKLKKDYESKEVKMKEEIEALSTKNERCRQQIEKMEMDYEDKIKSLAEENKKLREENDRLLSYGDDKDIGIQEVQSLRVVLELKQTEVADLRRALAEATQKLEVLIGAEEKAAALNARCEDLQHQLQRKSEYEQNLLHENIKLQESFKEETNQKRRLSQYNEELQWKLKQNKEVISKVMEQAEESVFNRSILSSSFNERHSSAKLNLERTLSFRERSYSNKSNISYDGSNRSRKSKNSLEFEMDDISPPTSPKVKGVVEKSDSVSYVLDLDESPEVVASRIVRRSFRNSTPPKNTPTKSPSNKRPRIRNPLSLSASSSAIITSNKEENDSRPRSASARNGNCDNDVFVWQSSPRYYDEEKLDESCESANSSMKLEDDLLLDEDNEVDLPLPALPSELDRQNGVRALPMPKHLAGEAMISESNSEDESTSSSQL